MTAKRAREQDGGGGIALGIGMIAWQGPAQSRVVQATGALAKEGSSRIRRRRGERNKAGIPREMIGIFVGRPGNYPPVLETSCNHEPGTLLLRKTIFGVLTMGSTSGCHQYSIRLIGQ